MDRLRALGRDERGALIVEFAMIVPILFFIVFGIVDFGRAYFTMNSLATAVREGARYGAVLETPDVAPYPAQIRQRVKDFALTFGGDTLRDADITSTLSNVPGSSTLTVTASYTFRPITPLFRMIGRDSIPMQQTAVFRWEWDPQAP